VPGDRPILIAGAGIGGLALAIALARRGIGSRVLERHMEYSGAGAGIQLGPNAVGVLSRLGVAARLAPYVGKPHTLRVFDGGSARVITDLPLGPWLEARHGAPYWVAHRADLHKALIDTAAEEPLIEIIPGCDVTAFDCVGDHVSVQTAAGNTHRGTLLVGADGLWSTVRRQLWPDAPLTYSGRTAARAVLPRSRLPAKFQEAITGIWLAPSAHIVHYPVRGGDDLALAILAEEDWPGEGWGLPVDRDALLARLHGFSPELINLLALADDWRRWPLYDPTPLAAWSRDRVTLLGDAAHPVLPFLAQGGALALEDAEVLSAAVAKWPEAPQHALAHYERVRRPRAVKMQQTSRQNGLIYHMAPPLSYGRDLTLRLLPGHTMMARYDWVYSWQPDAP
jgi:salicylate hydroxylase